MKLRISPLAAILALGLLLCACGKGEDKPAADTAADTAAAVEQVELKGPSVIDELAYDYDISEYVSLPEHSALEIECDLLEVTDEDVDLIIENALAGDSEAVEITDRGAKEGDRVTYDVKGVKADGTVVDEGEGRVLIIGSKIYLEGFSEHMIGLMAGDEITFDYKYADDYYNESFAGVECSYTVNVKKVEQITPPELTDDYVKSLKIEGVEDVAAYREDMRSRIEASAAEQNAQTKRDAVYDVLLSQTDVTKIPDREYDYYREQFEKSAEASAKAAGVELADYVTSQYGSQEKYEESSRNFAISKIVDDLMIYSLAREYGVEVSDEEYEARMLYGYDNYAKNLGISDLAEFEEIYSADVTFAILKVNALDAVAATAVVVGDG